MSVDLSEILVVGVSTRALFNLEIENDIFQNKGITAFRKYQLDNEEEILEPGTAFYLVKSLLKLNKIANKK
jgi:5'-nucleotidase